MGEGWGQMANQLYQHQWDTQEHSGWSDEEEHDPDLPLGQTRKSADVLLLPVALLSHRAQGIKILLVQQACLQLRLSG